MILFLILIVSMLYEVMAILWRMQGEVVKSKSCMLMSNLALGAAACVVVLDIIVWVRSLGTTTVQ